MKKLIILNYQREIPPFMITEIKYAEKYFEHVEYITPCLYNDNSFEIENDKVHVTQINKMMNWKDFFYSFLGLFRKEVWLDVLKAFKNKKLSKDFFRHLMLEIYPGEVLYQETKKYINTHCQDDQVCLLSTWFNCNAYATARLKKKYNYVYAVSYAHAFEVNPERGRFIDISLNAFKHKYLDKVFFISKNVLYKYLQELNCPKQNFINKIEVHYLGSKNTERLYSKCDKGVFNILSCSGMVEVKRLDLILGVLEKWEIGKIIWTHIGSGPLWEETKRYAEYIEQKNPKVKIRLLGKKNNREVHAYYKTNPIDLFINVSVSEGLPVSIMEAISYGVPVIATNVGGTSEVVTDNHGYLMSPDINSEEIRQIMEKYWKLPTKQKKKMRESAKLLWDAEFDSEKNAAWFYSQLSEAITKNKSWDKRTNDGKKIS